MDSPAPQPAQLTDEQLAQLSSWRQGDVVALNTQVWLAHGSAPMTPQSQTGAGPGKLWVIHESAPHGLAVLTQTCDLVPRADRHRPFVAVAPLVQLQAAQLSEAKRGRLPRYAHLPALSDGSFCVDLDRITTIETGLLIQCDRSAGLNTDAQRVAFSRATGRKFARFAFPDELSVSMAKWRERVISRHGRPNSPEGELYRLALDVVASAQPSWDAQQVHVTITVLIPAGALPPVDPELHPSVDDVEMVNQLSSGDIAEQLLNGTAEPQRVGIMYGRLQEFWSQLCQPTGRIEHIDFQLLDADIMTADEYRSSYQLDLEFLTNE